MPRQPNTQHQLLACLEQGEHLTYDDIYTRLGITKRHARRLLDALREEGYAIESRFVGPRKAFFIPEHHRSARLREVAFEEEEALAVTVAAEAVRATFHGTPLAQPLQRAFDKLISELAPGVFSYDLETQPAHWHFGPLAVPTFNGEVFQLLSRAIEESQTVRIRYFTASSNAYSERLIDPLLLGTPGGSWVVVAWCHKRQKTIDFALHGIEELEPTGDFFNPPSGFNPVTHFSKRFAALSGQMVKVRILVEADRMPYFKRKLYHPSQVIESERPDGRAIITFEAAGLEAMRAFCQSWGVGITVLDPPELVQKMRHEAKLIASRYSSPP